MTELVLIIERSGAMRGLEGDTIGGFNAVIHRLRPPKKRLRGDGRVHGRRLLRGQPRKKQRGRCRKVIQYAGFFLRNDI